MKRLLVVFAGVCLLLLAIGCLGPGSESESAESKQMAAKPVIAVTYSVLAKLVSELVGESFQVKVIIPDGQDPHDWEPSAQDIAELGQAKLIVENGLGLEIGLEKTLAQLRTKGLPFFTAAEHITVRHVGEGEIAPHEHGEEEAHGHDDEGEEHDHEHEHSHEVGAEDPHLWLDPLAMKQIILALSTYLKTSFQVDTEQAAQDLSKKLDDLHASITNLVAGLPKEKRRLVTGHESLGYFADRYGFKLIGAIIPSLTSQAEVSAGDLGKLKKLITDNKARVIFTELGTSPKVADTLAKETGARVVNLNTHLMADAPSYVSFLTTLTTTVVENLR